MTKTKYNSKHLILFPAVFTIFMFIMTLVSTAIMERTMPLHNSMILFFSIPGHLLMMIYMIIAIGKNSLFSNELEQKINLKDIIPGILIGLLALISASLISFVLPASKSTAHEFLFDGMGFVLIVYIVFASFIAPIVEEMVFRGFFWRVLEKMKINKYLILLITSFLFAAMHMDVNRFPALLSGGLIYGLLRMKTGSSGRSIVAHITNNLIVTLLTFILPLLI